MNQELLQLGGIFVLAYGLLELLKSLIVPIVNKLVKNGNGDKNEQRDIDIAVIKEKVNTIETNHLKHIEDWMDKHDGEHKDDRELLIKIATKLNIKN